MRSTIAIFFIVISYCSNMYGQDPVNAEKIIFVSGGDFSKPFIIYVAALTKKANPKICFIPTASADNPYGIASWYASCVELSLRPYVLRTFINAAPNQKSFEETLLGMDAIIVGGGSTLNMIAVWKAQGIDTVLKKAYDRGIVLAGGSAGSLCWFTGGYSDSRPKELTIISGLSFLKFTHSPHYHSEPTRRPLYLDAVLTGKLKPGYACDDKAGLLFINGELKKSVSQVAEQNNYFVSVVDGKIKEDLLPAEILK